VYDWRITGAFARPLIYLDPPFNSNRAYNVIYSGGGEEDRAQIEAFDDRK
jgi:hypothetical protein